MGVVNVTPDSFSDGGRFLDAGIAVAHGRRLIEEGADLLDIGGESTRPGADPVPAEEELDRVVPVIEGLTRAGGRWPEPAVAAKSASDAPVPVPISVDTSKLVVAEAALRAGASIVNDVTALRGDPGIGALCVERGAGLILMHMLGTPRTMQEDPRYEDVVDDVRAFLAERAEVAIAAGVPEGSIRVDPGIGFGKTREHNLELLGRLDEIASLGFEVVVGTSRKRFIAGPDGPPAGERLGGTIASSLLAWQRGAGVLRVHDVAPMRQALEIAAAIESAGRN